MKNAIYLYVIGQRDALEQALAEIPHPSAIEPEESLAIVAERDLAAIVSAVPLETYGEGRFEERLRDPVWTAERAMRQQGVAQFFAVRQSVIPLRFGVMYLDETGVQSMLREQARTLSQTLLRIEGCEEWGLKLHADRAALTAAIPDLSPKLRELADKAAAASEGQRYLLEKQMERQRTAEMKAFTHRAVMEIAATLEKAGRAMKRIPVAEDETRQTPAVIGKAAFLIAKPKVASFKTVAEKLAERYAGAGIKVELTGPWPAYNFVE